MTVGVGLGHATSVVVVQERVVGGLIAQKTRKVDSLVRAGLAIAMRDTMGCCCERGVE